MVTKYYDIQKSHLVIKADDAVYGVRFAYEVLYGKTWEFDPMSDAIGQYTSKRTGKIAIEFIPVKETMAFSEDAGRRTKYSMHVVDARNFWRFLKDKKPHYWFALDMAFEGELKGFDPEMVNLMENCAGCATDLQPV